MKHILDNTDTSVAFIQELFVQALWYERAGFPSQRLAGKVVACFFGEPSTRTRLSFESAVQRMGGSVITAADASASSSLKKGESLKDTFKTLGHYADLIVMRHSDEDWINVARKHATVPVISGGNGKDQHPTQALLDLYVVWKNLQKDPSIFDHTVLQNTKWMLCGDLKYSRTVHSLLPLLKAHNCEVFMVPDNNSWTLDYACMTDPDEIEALLPDMDVVYMTRVQKERHTGIDKDEEMNRFIMNGKRADMLKDSALILHPLPRGEEIHEEVDEDWRAVYLTDQMMGGVYVRAALLNQLLGRNDEQEQQPTAAIRSVGSDGSAVVRRLQNQGGT